MRDQTVRRLLWINLLVMAMLLLSVVLPHTATATPSTVVRYQVVATGSSVGEVQAVCVQYGLDGWQLVGVFDDKLIFSKH
jgi:hypothetical protein